MPSFEDLLARAKQAPPEHRDVGVTLDAQAADRIAGLEQQLLALEADERLTDPRVKQIREAITETEAAAAESLVTLRFTKLTGKLWTELTGPSTPRPDVGIDAQYGYNYHAVCREAAVVSGARLDENGDPQRLTSEQWADLFDVLSGHEYERIVSTVWQLNEFGPQQRVRIARKASAAGSVKSSTSPSTSESRRED